MENPLDTVESQYANSPTIVRLIESFNEWIDPTADLDQFYSLIWDLDTAVGVGLDIWGRIVGVGRVFQVAASAQFGFAEAMDSTSETPFNCAPFYTGGATTGNYALTDDGYRTLILAKAAANISDGSIASINQILLMLFPGRGNIYVFDGQDMTMTYSAVFQPTPLEAAIIAQSGVMPKPAGVSVSFVFNVPPSHFTYGDFSAADFSADFNTGTH